MLGTATLALLLVGTLGAVLGQIATRRETVRDMARESVAVERLVTTQFVETTGTRPTLDRLASLLENGTLRADSALGRRLRNLLATAEVLTGGRVVDLGWIGEDGKLHVLLNDRIAEALRFDVGEIEDGRDSVVRRQLPDDPDTVLALAHPMQNSGLVVIVLQRTAQIDRQAFFRVMLLVFVVAALLSAIVARLLARRLSRRGSSLAEAARRLADGDYSARVSLDGDDEIADIARSFNEMADRLDAAQRSEREFLMSVGHDLRTPLTTIGGYAEALEQGGLEEADVERIGGVLERETGRLRRLIEDLMLLARLDAKEFELRPEVVDVTAHVKGIAEGFRPRAEAAGVRLTVETEDVGRILVDPDRLAQVVANLLENALRYTPEAGTVALRVGSDDRAVTIEVVDSGPGIDAEDLPHVFDRFYVAHRYRRVRPEGSGLGLSIVHRIVDAMGGDVTVTSDDGGTVFRVVIPR